MEASLDKVKQSADRLKGSTVEAKGSVGKVSDDAAGMKETATEAVAMVVAYARQETIDPLKALGRYAIWGIIGAVLIVTGVFLISLGALRAVQFETAPHLTGDWSWVPYLSGAVVAGGVAVLALFRIFKVPE